MEELRTFAEHEIDIYLERAIEKIKEYPSEISSDILQRIASADKDRDRHLAVVITCCQELYHSNVCPEKSIEDALYDLLTTVERFCPVDRNSYRQAIKSLKKNRKLRLNLWYLSMHKMIESYILGHFCDIEESRRIYWAKRDDFEFYADYQAFLDILDGFICYELWRMKGIPYGKIYLTTVIGKERNMLQVHSTVPTTLRDFSHILQARAGSAYCHRWTDYSHEALMREMGGKIAISAVNDEVLYQLSFPIREQGKQY